MSKDKLTKIASSTMDAIRSGKYKKPSGEVMPLKDLVESSVKRSVLYRPDYVPDHISASVRNESPEIIVTRESTLQAAARLSLTSPCVLNFASAKNPGGGFLRGASAQEESLARSSTLYPTLIVHPEFYEENKRSQRKNIGLYLNYAIYSPDVYVIKDDAGNWLEDPYSMSVVTSPAPNRTAIFSVDQDDKQVLLYPPSDQDVELLEKQIATVLDTRICQILSIMAWQGHRTIVLGAWGCGVFGNDPLLVAELMKENLKRVPFFDMVVFPIYDRSDSKVLRSFEQIFGQCVEFTGHDSKRNDNQ